MKHYLKKYLKYYKVRQRLSREEREKQQTFVEDIKKEAAQKALSPLSENGFRNFSQFEEDGLILYLFSLLPNAPKTFVEFGADDGINSNAANLHFHHDFTGVFIDGNPKAIERGRYFYKKYGNANVKAPVFIEAMITAENINELITRGGLNGSIGLLSIDIDGNDYWVWKAIDCVQPDIVVIETHNEFGMHDIIVPYDPNYFYPGKHADYHGASPIAMTKLAHNKGYRLVGANELGFNFIYIREELCQDTVPTVTIESLLQHPSNREAQARFEAIRDWAYVTETFTDGK